MAREFGVSVWASRKRGTPGSVSGRKKQGKIQAIKQLVQIGPKHGLDVYWSACSTSLRCSKDDLFAFTSYDILVVVATVTSLAATDTPWPPPTPPPWSALALAPAQQPAHAATSAAAAALDRRRRSNIQWFKKNLCLVATVLVF